VHSTKTNKQPEPRDEFVDVIGTSVN
jgi:hypothetical protein